MLSSLLGWLSGGGPFGSCGCPEVEPAAWPSLLDGSPPAVAPLLVLTMMASWARAALSASADGKPDPMVMPVLWVGSEGLAGSIPVSFAMAAVMSAEMTLSGSADWLPWLGSLAPGDGSCTPSAFVMLGIYCDKPGNAEPDTVGSVDCPEMG